MKKILVSVIMYVLSLYYSVLPQKHRVPLSDHGKTIDDEGPNKGRHHPYWNIREKENGVYFGKLPDSCSTPR